MAKTTMRRAGRRPGALYFPVVSTLLVGLSVLAFADNLITDIHQPSNSDPQMVVHGLIAAAWVFLFAAQAWLIYFGRIAAHRRLGPWVFAVAAGLALSTLYLFVSKFHGWAAMESEVLANRLLLPVFVFCTVLAYARRNRPDWHKRLLLIGTMALLEPVLARIYDPLFGPLLPAKMSETLDMFLFLSFLFTSWLGLIGSLWLYDRLVIGRVHRVTIVGSGAIVAINALVYLR